MNYRFTIGKKIGTGFIVLILFIIVVFGATYLAVNNGIQTFQKNDQTSKELIEIITPSKEKINKLRLLINESKQLAIQWVNNQSREDVPDKVKLKHLIYEDIPAVIDKIEPLSEQWKEKQDTALLNGVKTKIQELFGYYEEVMMFLPDIASYDDFSYFFARELIAQDGDIPVIFEKIDKDLLKLQDNFEKKEGEALELVKHSSTESKAKFESLKFYWFLGGALIIAAILIAFFTTNTIVKPITKLRSTLLSLGRGEFPKEKMAISNDEIGDMSLAMNKLVDGLKSTTEFAKNVGQSKFDTEYTPLSENDILGHALLKMRDNLAETERILEQKVKQRTEEVVKQRDEIEQQRGKLEELYKNVTDSILYAKRLQYSILPPKEKIQDIIPKSFVYFKPKDIVSGDFYWVEKIKNQSLYAAVDCTGHGVPGAFMSLVGANGLNSAVREHALSKPSEILDYLNEYVSESLNKSAEDSSIRDGMDMTLCAIDYGKMELQYAGANNPLYIIRDGKVLITKADKFAIASFKAGEKKYTNHTIKLEKGDVIYVFSDGYADQFGGVKGKKFMYKNFRKLLVEIHQLSIDEQKEVLHKEMKNWQGDVEQVDDILVIGVKI
ncbi:MAG TPA: HAMP domain-containing protein [Crocinitomix sp.]|nr:HAMP domain-containing protein [Crocinitomix sp.]